MVEKRILGELKLIGEGSLGRVYDVLNFRLPGSTVALAYKEIRPNGDRKQRHMALRAMKASVDFRKSLAAPDQADLEEYTTWPLEMVTDNRGDPCGVLMPILPADFFLTTKPATGDSKRLVFDLSWLSANEELVRKNGVDRNGAMDTVVRVALLAQLVYAVGRLHRHGVVYGDLSLKNAALALNPPRVKLLDCDATAALTDTGRKQLHSPFFEPPEMKSGVKRLQDHSTDVYKLALCVVRGMQYGCGVTQASDPNALRGLLDDKAIQVLTRALDTEPSKRPTAKELFICLEQTIVSRSCPPVLRAASLDRRIRIRGMDVLVTWLASAATQVRLTGANGLDIVLTNPSAFPNGYVVTPRGSGEIWVEVANRHGRDRMLAGTVELYDLPSFSIAECTVQGLPRLEIPEVLSALPAVPAVSTYEHPVPRVDAPSLSPFLEAVQILRLSSSLTGAVLTAPSWSGLPQHEAMGNASGWTGQTSGLWQATREASRIMEEGLRLLRRNLERSVPGRSTFPGVIPEHASSYQHGHHR